MVSASWTTTATVSPRLSMHERGVTFARRYGRGWPCHGPTNRRDVNCDVNCIRSVTQEKRVFKAKDR